MLASSRPRGVSVSRLALALGLASAFMLSACGSDDADDPDTAVPPDGAEEACVQTAESFLADWQEFPETLPTSPPARYTQLEEAAPSDLSIVYLTQNFPADQATADAVAEGAELLGWNASSVNFDSSVPDLLAKFDQAIAEGPDFIAVSGFPAAAMQQSIDAAEAADINVILSATADDPVATPGLAGIVNGPETQRLVSQISAYQMLADSGCTGDTAVFTLDFPILQLGVEAYQSVVKENCPDCAVEVTPIQAQDLGTPDATQQMVAQLQANPDTKYAYTVIGNVAGGLAQGLETAGIEDVRIFGQVPDEASIAALRNGTNAWWVNQNPYVNGYEIVDAAVRIAATGETADDVGGYPLALLTPENVPEGEDLPVIPENILDLYAETWQIG